MTIRAIPTVYDGVQFRSRLEADWAKTLDDLAIAWTYEPEGYRLSDGTCYSPDFYLPGPKAWLEVKGAHMQRITKVEQFAAELWAESGCTSTYDRGAPMVLLGTDPKPADYPFPEHLAMVGVMGLGKRYSVGIVECSWCFHMTVISLWQDLCRSCGAEHGDGQEAWFGSWINEMHRPFRRVTRPVGRVR